MHGFYAFSLGPGWTIDFDGEKHSLFVRHVDGEETELHRIDGLEVTLKIAVRISDEIPLHHRRLAEIDVNYAFGEGTVGSTPALIVATEGEQGGNVSIRLNPEYKKKPDAKAKKSKAQKDPNTKPRKQPKARPSPETG